MRLRKTMVMLALLAGSLHAAELPKKAETDSPTPPDVPAAAPAPLPPVPARAGGEERLPLDDLRIFVEVFERIRASYVDPVDDRRLFENAIRGMLSSLDPHSAYLDKRDFEELQNATTGEFEGIGLDVGMEEGVVKVIAPIDESPAAKAGLRAGDFIIKIDGKSVQGMSLGDAIVLMRGKPGTKVRLTVLRKGEEPREVEVTRARIEISSVRTRPLEPGFHVVRISQFQMHTGRDLRREIEKLTADPKAPVQGIVLDLRNNPGGVLDGAVAVSDLFLDSGRIVTTRSRIIEGEQHYTASAGELLPGVPVVVLVNGGSASASEIVAGALQDNHRALIVGTTTFGKGSVQTVLPLTAGKGIKLTTARYYTPSGRSIQAEGIKPDIMVRPAQVELMQGGDLFHEADLRGHLGNENAAAAARGEARNKERPLVERDFQLAEAVNLLKAAVWHQTRAPAASKAAPATPPPAPKQSAPARRKKAA